MKRKIFLSLVIILFIGGLFLLEKPTTLASCPSNTTVGETWAHLVGEVTDDGGDPTITVWFQYGLTDSYGSETTHFFTVGKGPFCYTIYNLTPCTTYHFRAVAQNSAGTSYGNDETFTTLCSAKVDIKANNSDGPLTLSYQDSVQLSWTSQYVTSCQASGDWSGSKPTSGSESIKLNSIKTYYFTLNCTTPSGQTFSDSVQVVVRPKPPQVITKPAVVTR